MPFRRHVIISDWVYRGRPFSCFQILLKISITTSIMVSPPVWTRSACILSTQADFLFSVLLVQSQLSHEKTIVDLLRAGCNTELTTFYHSYHDCIALSNMFYKRITPKIWKLWSVKDFWPRPAIFLQLGLISDPLISWKLQNEINHPKGQENKINTVMKGRETFLRWTHCPSHQLKWSAHVSLSECNFCSWRNS